MPSEKKKTSLLKSTDYKINGNLLRAFYDKQGKLVFILDSTVDEIKPNVLLVMASRGDRKWDDVLANDYAMDLELVRPKKDNKYQKLDIEYDGLVVYDNLIRAYNDGGNVKKALRELQEFREVSAHRSASERLAVATSVAENARETIERTGDTIVELQAKIKATKSKVATLRRNVGKEPTKQSAAKILRAEAQLDVLTSKLERAKKRLENAKKRLLTAEDDIAAAQAVLDLVPNAKDKNFQTVETVAKTTIKKQEATEVEEETDDTDEDVVFDDEEPVDEEAEDVEQEEDADQEVDVDVKPLFDKDPKIIDENIAFKPISFDEGFDDKNEPDTELSVEYDDKEDVAESQESETESETTEKPELSFEPPAPKKVDTVDIPMDKNGEEDVALDDIFAELEDDEDDEAAEDATEKENTTVDEAEIEPVPQQKDADVSPVLEKDVQTPEIVAAEEKIEEYTEPALNVTPVVKSETENAAIVAPVAVPTPAEKLVRPASPAGTAPVVNAPEVSQQHHKPNVLYYVLLLVLIALSVFTLWLYQRSNVTDSGAPSLVPETQEVVQTAAEPVAAAPAPVVEDTDVAPVSVTEDDTDPFVASGEEIKEPDSSKIEEIAEKSLNKVAEAADINTQEVETEEQQDSEEETVEPTVVNKPEYKVTADEVFTSDDSVSGGSLCEGDVAPDTNGCCPGETYSIVNGQNVCCPDDGGDCFPPMF